MGLIPDLIKLGFMKINDENIKTVNIPIITSVEHEKLKSLSKEYFTKYLDITGDKLIKMIKKNILFYPNRINPISRCTHMLVLEGFGRYFVEKAIFENTIQIQKGKNYPVSIIIEKIK